MKKLSRRDFLRIGALTSAGAALAACQVATPAAQPTTAPEPTQAPAATEAPQPTPTPVPAQPQAIVLEIQATDPEYENAERQIWDIFEAENPGIKVNLFSVNEDQWAAYQAKIAGGYKPAIIRPSGVTREGITKDNYTVFVNLAELDFPWWDRWTWDVKNKFTELYGLSGPRALDVFNGFVFNWTYHEDLMAEAGLDPRRDVKTWDDLLKFIEEGTAWASSNPNVDRFWDQGWNNWVYGYNLVDAIPLAFAEGQLELQADCWMGKAKFNAEDSPYRPFFEFLKQAYDKGWMPQSFWTREWESDMEASYIGRKSIMLIHGPWIWDKMLAADPTAKQLGLPLTPPAEGQTTWIQYVSRVDPTGWDGYAMLEGVQKLPEWEAIKTAFYWWHSPNTVSKRANVVGRDVTYKLDEPLELTTPQWLGVVKEIDKPGGLWEDTKYVDPTAWGEIASGPYRKGGSPGVWDWESGAFAETLANLMTDKMSVQEVLDLAQANYDQSFEGLG